MAHKSERMTIGQVADEIGVATSALRFYEREGLVLPADPRRRQPGPAWDETVRRYGYVGMRF